MSATVSSYQRSGGGTVQRNADVLPFPFPARPQAMTGYVRFVELGNIVESTESRIVQVGASDNTSPFFVLNETDGFYGVTHGNGATSVRVTLTVAPSIGQIVELVAQLNADGSVKLIQSIDGAAVTETATSSAVVLSSAWSGALLWINGVSTSFVGVSAFRNIVFERGVQSLATMRRLAGV